MDYQRWLSKIMGYDFIIQYKPGAANKAADALSHQSGSMMELGSLISTCGVWWDSIQGEIRQDPFIQHLTAALSQQGEAPKGYFMEGGILKYKGRVVIPSKSSVVGALLHEYHNSPVGGHSREVKTYQSLAREWFWPGMRKMVSRFVQQCSICQQNKASSLRPAGLLQPLPIRTAIWEDISLDFVEGLPKSQGFDTVLVVVDRLTKFSHFIALKHPFTARTMAKEFIREIVRLHGFPLSIISDRDRIFLSIFWREIFRLQGTSLRRSTAYHPQTDGQTEVVNKTLEAYLRCFMGGQPRTWYSWLPWAELWYNSSPHSSTQVSPFKAMYGRDPPFFNSF